MYVANHLRAIRDESSRVNCGCIPRNGRIIIGRDYLRTEMNCKIGESFRKRESSPRAFNSRFVILVYCPDSPATGLCAFEKEFVADLVQTILLFIRRRINALAIIGKTLLFFQ